MFAAFIAAFAAILLACLVSSNRKHMIATDKKEETKTSVNEVKVARVATPNNTPDVAAPKNSGSINAILYIGCFLVIAAFMGFCSSIDGMLVPPLTIGVTLLALFASIMLRLFSQLLKSSSIAFNISAQIMFIFWFPSLEALGFDSAYMPLTVFCVALISSVISASVFKIRGFWTIPFLIFIPTVISFFVAIASSMYSSDAYTCLVFFGITICYFIAAIACRYLWRSHNRLLPIPVRSSVLVFSYIYLIAGIIAGVFGAASELAPFIGITTLILAMTVFFIDYKLAGKSLAGLRIGALIAAPVICFDILVLIEADYYISVSAFIYSVIITAIINGIISLVSMIKHPTEKAHRTERIILGLCVSALSLACFASMGFKQEFIYDASRYVSSQNLPIYAPSVIARIDPSPYITAMLVSEIVSIVSVLAFSVISIFIDRNAFALVPASLILGAALSDPAIDNNLFTGITLGILSLVAAFAYFAVRTADEKSAMAASITSSVSLAVISFFYCIGEGSFFWLPILLASVIVLIFGYTSKKANTIDLGYYILAASFSLAIVDICSNFSIPVASKNALYEIAWLAIPLTVLIRDLIHDIEKGKPDKNTASFYLGTIVAWLFTGGFDIFYSLMSSYSDSQFIYAIIVFIARVLLMLNCFRKKIPAMEIISIVLLVFTIISFVGFKMEVVLLITGLGLIGLAIFLIYRATNKPAAEADNQKPAPDKTEIQIEKTEDPDNKTLA